MAAQTNADIASLAIGILNDKINTYPNNPIYPGAYMRRGRLYIPNRGVLIPQEGDYIMIDTTGWPILVSANAIANGPWAHS